MGASHDEKWCYYLVIARSSDVTLSHRDLFIITSTQYLMPHPSFLPLESWPKIHDPQAVSTVHNGVRAPKGCEGIIFPFLFIDSGMAHVHRCYEQYNTINMTWYDMTCLSFLLFSFLFFPSHLISSITFYFALFFRNASTNITHIATCVCIWNTRQSYITFKRLTSVPFYV